MRLKNKKIVFFLLSSYIFFSTSLAQTKKSYLPNQEEADNFFNNQNYRDALVLYLQLLENEPENYLFQFKTGICYLKTNINKTEAIKYLKFCFDKKKTDKDVLFALGKAYHLNNQFDSALIFYNKCLQSADKNFPDTKKVKNSILQAEQGKLLLKNPVHVSFSNVGPGVNTEFPDYLPYVTSNEKKLFFTSRRKGLYTKEIEIDGYYASDIFVSEDLNGKWDKAKHITGPLINTSLDEELVGMRPDGEELVIYKDNIKEFGNLFYSYKLKNNFSTPEKFSDQINEEIEFSGSISDDDQTFFFVRKSKNSTTEQDIYFCKKLPNGQWGLPILAGSEINTEHNEDFPYLAKDGKTFYFSSEGHNSMGGYDLFKSEWDSEKNTFSKPLNLGYPINTADDENNISIMNDNRIGYISACRKEGYGDLDIYRVKFEDRAEPITLIKVFVSYSDNDIHSKSCTAVNIFKKSENKIFQTYKIDSMKGTCTLALTAGKYEINILCEGYAILSDQIEIPEETTNQNEEKRNYTLQKSKHK